MNIASKTRLMVGRHQLGASLLALSLVGVPSVSWAQDPADERNPRKPSDSTAGESDQSELGSVAGQVTAQDADTDVSGIVVVLEGSRHSTRTDNLGRFRIDGVPPGTYILVARSQAAPATRQSVTVSASQTSTADIALGEPSGTEADVITVTGTRPGAERRSSSPVSIVTAEEIERKQVTNMSDLLRGEIPGIFVINAGLNDWTTHVFTRGSTSWNYGFSDLNNDYSKIFIDGVELARPTLLSLIDPRTIERIETTRGPQAGIIYGTDGSNGLMKIVTKKGTTDGGRPALVATVSAGIMESEYKPDGVTPWVQDHSLQLYGGDDDFGYRLGANYQSVGEWAPRYDSEVYGLSGGLRARRGDFTASLSAFHFDRKLALSTYPEAPVPGEGLDYPMTETLVALTLGYQASANWQHTLTLGHDQNSFGYEGNSFGRNSLQNTKYTRRTLRYFTAYDTDLAPSISAIFTAGGDITLYNSDGFSATGFQFVDGRPDFSDALDYHTTEESWRNFGYYGMAEFGYRDQLFLTLAARVEEGLRYVVPSEERQIQPRVGLAYVLDQGPASIKFRGQWGRSVRAPITDLRAGSAAGSIVYRPPNIGPEVKVGWDAGVDLTWSGVGTLSVTYFDEEGRDLIMPVSIDERSRPRTREYQNYGVITNRGWEFEADAAFGPVSLRGNFALIDNRIKKISSLAGTGQNAPGSRRISVPDYTGGATATVQVLNGTVSANFYVLGPRVMQFVDEKAPALWRVNLRAEQELTDTFSVFGRIDNLLNDQTSERYDFTIAPGRTFVLGLRATV